MPVIAMHGFRCEFCGVSAYHAGQNEACPGGMELQIAADALARVLWCVTNQEHEPAPEGWHVRQHPDGSVTYAMTLRPSPGKEAAGG